ncbi:hypothetical protein [Mesorhizobium sp. SP-1A]|uniref:hypothetical protein n=1 Tax=Mesorhizobium sp. SP-1A TaxID=3077840 RepID=UPI0028F73A69|nr:hypothetical protein [Mesorhizobium sp. SP-1A]
MAGNAVIGALRVNLGIDSAQFSEGLKQARSSADAFASALKTTFVAAAAAAAAALGAIALGVRNTLKEADDMSKMASKIGIPVEELSKLKYAADLAGVSMEGLKGSVSILAKNMADAAAGGKKGTQAFGAIGISVRDANGQIKSTSQVMAEISDKFAKMPDGAQKTALAMKLMGKSGADMIPLLNAGSAALNATMAEAKALGIEISSGMAANAERFNDNMSRMSAALGGLVVGLTSALAPALAAASDAMVGFVKWTISLLDYLPTLAEYAAVAGGSLAIMLSPVLIGYAEALAEAILVGMVGAVRALTAAIAANPLGALVIAITTAVTAAYYFRDEIQKAIGIDVVGIAKDAGNLIINSFRAAFSDVTFIWNNFGTIMGAAVVGGVNAAIRAINGLLEKASTGIDWLIKKVNGALTSIGMSPMKEIGGGFSLKELANPAASDLAKANAAHVAEVKGILASDPLGDLGKAFSGATPAAQNFSNALGSVNDELDDMGGGGGKGKKGKASKLKQAKEGIDRVARAMETAKETLGQGFGSIFEGLINKTLTWKDAIMQVGQALLKYANSMNVAQGGKGLFGGGIVQGLFGSLLGFASGGSFQVGGSGGIDSQLVAFRASPNERVSITKPGQEEGGRGVYAPVYNIDARGADQAAIARLEKGLEQRDRNFARMVDHRMDVRQYRKTRG